MAISKRSLTRLYPRAWRRRYGDEFALLLDATPLSAGVIANVFGAAAREWIVRTLTGRVLLGPAVAYAALLAAQVLSAAVAAAPTFSYEGGQTIVTPPWTVSLGYLHPLIGFAVLGRWALRLWHEIRMSDREFACWLLCLFVGAVAQQWGYLSMNLGTGVAPWSLWAVWSSAAVSTTSNLMFLFLVSHGTPSPETTASPYTGSSRPLGLS